MRALLLLALSIVSALATDIIPTARYNPWWQHAGIRGGIPVRDTIYITLSSTVTVAQLNAHLDACPSNQVVKLLDGTYSFSTTVSIDKSGVTLRGEGTNTVLRDTSSGNALTAFVKVGNGPGEYFDGRYGTFSETAITAGAVQWSSNITVSSTAGLSVGKLIGIDGEADGTIISATGNGGYLTRPTTRAYSEYTTIVAINGNDLTIEPPLIGPLWTNATSEEVFWDTTAHTEMSGVENLKVVSVNGSASAKFLVHINLARNCWAKGIHTENGGRAQIATEFASNAEVRGCYVCNWSSFLSSFYGIEMRHSSHGRVEDNIIDNHSNPYMCPSVSGTVYAFNYNTNDNFQLGGGSQSWHIFGHGGHSHMNLIEGNHFWDVVFERTEGYTDSTVVLRNRITCEDQGSTGFGVRMMGGHRFISFVGNVLGTSTGELLDGNAVTAVFDWDDDENGDARNNSAVTNTLILYKNWFAPVSTNNGVRYYNDTINTYNAAAGEDIPTSYAYPNGQPSWWPCGTNWPPYDPLTQGSSPASGMALPAGYRYRNMNVEMTNLPACAGGDIGGPLGRPKIRGVRLRR